MKIRVLLVPGVACLLVGCGGGGSSSGGGASGGAQQHQYPLTITATPGNLTASLVQSVSALFTVNAQVAGTVSTGSTIYVFIDDTSGVLQADKVTVTENSPTAYVAHLVTSTSLAPGEHQGSIDVKVCSDSSCGTIYGRTSIPYDFTVESSTNLSSIAGFSGISDWQTARGEAAQTSYVPITLDPSRFTVRWLQTNFQQLVVADRVPVGSLVTDSADHLVILGVEPSADEFQTTTSPGGVIAFGEEDGSSAWHEMLVDSSGAQQEVGPLSFANGTVYATQGAQIGEGYGADVSLTAITAKTGAVAFRTPISGTSGIQLDAGNSGCSPGAPVVEGGLVLVNPGCITSGSAGAVAVAAFDATTGQSLWTGAVQGGSVGTSIAANGSDLYYIIPRATGAPGLADLYQASGSTHWQATLADGLGYAYATPALDASGGAILMAGTSNGPLIDRYDLSAAQLAWQITIPHQAQYAPNAAAMAVANGIAYIGYDVGIPGIDPAISALNTADGSTAWSWSPAKSSFGTTPYPTFIEDLIVTNNLLFVGTDSGVFAVDLSTHQTVWTLPMPGFRMAISPSGVLYVVSAMQSDMESGSTIAGPTLVAINLH